MVKRFAFGWGLGSIAAVCAVWSGSAQADPLTAKEILQDYNLVTNGNALTTSDIEGSAAIGGNFSGATIFNGTHSSDATSPQSFYVFGNLSNTNTLDVDDLGGSHPAPTLYYNGTVNPPPVSFNGRSTKATIPSGTTISDYTTPLNQLESTLAGETANNTNPSDPNNFTFDAVNYNAQGFAVFDISASALEAAGTIYFTNIAAGETVLINVTGITGNVTLKGNFSFGSPNDPASEIATQVIWNFEAPAAPGSYTITTQSDWYGAMLAGDYNVVNPSDIDGFLYANTFNGGVSNGAELHYYGFDGALPSAVPEPSTWAMMLAGFAGLGFAGFRRARASAAA
jgi:choice-of-anchor A domain-containing protein